MKLDSVSNLSVIKLPIMHPSFSLQDDRSPIAIYVIILNILLNTYNLVNNKYFLFN